MPSGSLPRLTETRINHYLSLAKNACQYSDYKRARLGAVLVYKGKVLSVGWNSTKTNPLQRELNRLRDFRGDVEEANSIVHAEVACLLKIKNIDIDWAKASIFVYRIKQNGSNGMARPCKGCMSYIKSLGIRNIYYSTDLGWAYERIMGGN